MAGASLAYEHEAERVTPHYGAKLRALREQTGLSCRRLAREEIKS